MSLETILQQLGLKERESEAYLALLELGEASVQEIAAKARMQRPNCYAVLDALVKKGLASYQVKGKGRRFMAEDPARLESLLREKERLLQAALPQLTSLHNLMPGKPKVRYYEGKQSVGGLYEEILSCQGYDCVYSPEYIIPVWGSEFNYVFGERAAKRGMRIREIIAGSVRKVAYEDLFHLPDQEVRYLPPDIPSQTDLILFSNRVALISYRPELHALVIEDSGIVQTLQLMFERMWTGLGN